MDLSKTTDLSAVTALFPHEDGTFDVQCMLFSPRDLIMERERTDRQPFQHWVNEGWITATSGNVIDHAVIREYVLEYAKNHKVERVLMDMTGAVQLGVELQGAGLFVESMGQGFKALSSPTKLLESLVLQNKIRHAGNPVLSWMAAGVTVETGAFEEIRPVKKKSTCRIDGIVALIFALGGWEANSVKKSAEQNWDMIIL
jgi:phage terminase large subunit-like protein